MAKKYIQEFKSKLSNGGTLSPEELQDFFGRLEGDLKDKKYGLVWESQTEQVIEQLKTNKVYLEEEQDLKITQDPDNPKSNILIEGDNYEALTYLVEIKQKIDVIYIDPPYNTGNKDFIYNDRFIDKEDGFRHSSWLSFMNKRLKLARELLSEEGVMIVSIDEHEMAQLKLLCNSIFGESNFIATVIWNNASRNTSNTINLNHEYILIYAKDSKVLNKFESVLDKDSIRMMYEHIKYCDSLEEAEKVLKGLTSELKKNDQTKHLTNYSNVDKDGRIFYAVDLSTPSKPNRRVLKDGTILEPLRNRGWQSEERINSLLDKGLIQYKSGRPYAKKFIDDLTEVNTSIVRIFTRQGVEEVQKILGSKKFDFPKPVRLIAHFLKMIPNKNAVVLDFFAGSGTTGHAVLELNKEDGGNRQFILCTNNENNIAEEVTYERLKRVMNGYTTPKGKDVPGIPSNLAYYKTNQVSKYDVDFDEVMLQHIIPTIQLTEGVYHRIRHSEHILQLGDSIFIFNQYMVVDDEIDTLVGLVKDEDILYIQEGQVDYIKSKLPEGVVYKYLEGILPTNR